MILKRCDYCWSCLNCNEVARRLSHNLHRFGFARAHSGCLRLGAGLGFISGLGSYCTGSHTCFRYFSFWATATLSSQLSCLSVCLCCSPWKMFAKLETMITRDGCLHYRWYTCFSWIERWHYLLVSLLFLLLLLLVFRWADCFLGYKRPPHSEHEYCLHLLSWEVAAHRWGTHLNPKQSRLPAFLCTTHCNHQLSDRAVSFVFYQICHYFSSYLNIFLVFFDLYSSPQLQFRDHPYHQSVCCTEIASQQKLLLQMTTSKSLHIVILACILAHEALWTMDVWALEKQLFCYQGYKLAIFILNLVHLDLREVSA